MQKGLIDYLHGGTGILDGLVKSCKKGFMQICISRISTGYNSAFYGILTFYEAIRNACPPLRKKMVGQTFMSVKNLVGQTFMSVTFDFVKNHGMDRRREGGRTMKNYLLVMIAILAGAMLGSVFAPPKDDPNYKMGRDKERFYLHLYQS